ncbi:MAG: hypothetical protein JW741_25430 [Sedimentisphaerales bacterium]|nr:hypothetical protein [Sedimentisphaerales bacterium]
MHTFSDTENRLWTLNMTIGAVKRVKAARKVNLLDPLGHRLATNATRKLREPLLTRIQTDVELLVDVIWLIVKPEADRLGVTDLQFAEALGGDAARDAYVAFMHEWRDFFQRLRHETECEAIAANLKLVAEDDHRRAALVPRVTQAALSQVEAIRQKALEKMEAEAEAPGPCATVTSSPEESESIPTD